MSLFELFQQIFYILVNKKLIFRQTKFFAIRIQIYKNLPTYEIFGNVNKFMKYPVLATFYIIHTYILTTNFSSHLLEFRTQKHSLLNYFFFAQSESTFQRFTASVLTRVTINSAISKQGKKRKTWGKNQEFLEHWKFCECCPLDIKKSLKIFRYCFRINKIVLYYLYYTYEN